NLDYFSTYRPCQRYRPQKSKRWQGSRNSNERKARQFLCSLKIRFNWNECKTLHISPVICNGSSIVPACIVQECIYDFLISCIVEHDLKNSMAIPFGRDTAQLICSSECRYILKVQDLL